MPHQFLNSTNVSVACNKKITANEEYISQLKRELIRGLKFRLELRLGVQNQVQKTKIGRKKILFFKTHQGNYKKAHKVEKWSAFTIYSQKNLITLRQSNYRLI